MTADGYYEDTDRVVQLLTAGDLDERVQVHLYIREGIGGKIHKSMGFYDGYEAAMGALGEEIMDPEHEEYSVGYASVKYLKNRHCPGILYADFGDPVYMAELSEEEPA